MNYLLISHSLQNVKLEKDIANLKEELDFYKSIFKTHQNSVIFNLNDPIRNRSFLNLASLVRLSGFSLPWKQPSLKFSVLVIIFLLYFIYCIEIH